jgi:hypothetical protein
MMGFAGFFLFLGMSQYMVSYGDAPEGGITTYDQSWEADGSTKYLQVVFFMETMYIHQSR